MPKVLVVYWKIKETSSEVGPFYVCSEACAEEYWKGDLSKPRSDPSIGSTTPVGYRIAVEECEGRGGCDWCGRRW